MGSPSTALCDVTRVHFTTPALTTLVSLPQRPQPTLHEKYLVITSRVEQNPNEWWTRESNGFGLKRVSSETCNPLENDPRSCCIF
ncbi:uncharacterized protein LACBIDRAFT_299933 [Laccaria bicolor S238N-H82]|uniref:Predicted protein n=1 Tax=Laccaria bicolor (strain S238N-H82 / ATCC MYA-4686) TaxID=486041 RepID=B0DFP0_LACBS|nr:uncharacterized protein LACBIDRAFT_299933 [Laccaria bicolor S238N-H82]EDR06493.1 predicted protein [Laccaria bicolor S238N-H82]|eukprot:XP_001882865.1 predicted protein [Laccaria bicolor S238N-H82]